MYKLVAQTCSVNILLLGSNCKSPHEKKYWTTVKKKHPHLEFVTDFCEISPTTADFSVNRSVFFYFTERSVNLEKVHLSKVPNSSVIFYRLFVESLFVFGGFTELFSKVLQICGDFIAMQLAFHRLIRCILTEVLWNVKMFLFGFFVIWYYPNHH